MIIAQLNAIGDRSQSYFGGKVSWMIDAQVSNAPCWVSVLFRWKGVLDKNQATILRPDKSQSYFGGKVSWMLCRNETYCVLWSQSYFGGKVSWIFQASQPEYALGSQSYFGGKVSWIHTFLTRKSPNTVSVLFRWKGVLDFSTPPSSLDSPCLSPISVERCLG